MASQFKRSLLAVALTGVLAMSMGISQPVLAQKASAVELYNQGIDDYGQGNSAKAIGFFEKAVAIDPQYGDALYNLGSIYYQRAIYDKAEKNFRKVVLVSPNDGQAKYNLALTLEKMGRTTDAINFYQQIPSTDSKYAQARKKIETLQVAATTTPATTNSSPSSYPGGYSNPPSHQNSTASATPGTKAPPFDSSAMKLTPKPFSKGFGGPTGMTIGPEGYLFVADYTKNIIYKVGANGEKTIFAQGTTFGGPIGLTYNPKSEELYVANYLKNNVVRVGPKRETAVLASGLSKPYNIYLDTYNNVLYISEQGSFIVSKIDLQ